jgi:ribulose-5-phosphate 4-epimerase/fuculose-1-phosphate aldolase
MHFSRIKASDLLFLDANDPDTQKGPDAPDPTAWGLHGSIHRLCPHARCVMHVHSIHATVLASLADSTLPPIDQNTATFFNRYVVDGEFGGLAFESEGQRCASMLKDPKVKTMIMGNRMCPQGHRLEAVIGLAVVLALVLLTVFGLPPASWLLDLNEFFKHEFWVR